MSEPSAVPSAAGTPPLPSIRSRVARALMLLSLVSSVGVVLAVWFSVRHEVGELLDDSLSASAQILCQAGAPRQGPPAHADMVPSGDLEFAWQWTDAQHRLQGRSSGAPTQAWAAQPHVGRFDAGSWLVLGHRCGGGMLYVAQTVAERHEAQWEVAATAAGAAVVAAALVVLWLVRRMRQELQPLSELSTRLEQWEPGRAPTLPPAQRREMLAIHRAIDGLAGRLARHVEDERAFAAHAAHALRTPLAGLQAQIAVAQREAGPGQLPRLARLAEGTERLQQVVQALLSLFRAGGEPQPQWVVLEALMAHLPLVGLEQSLPVDTRAWADPDLLAAALINLLDNAQRHGGATRVEIAVSMADSTDARTQRLRVQDNGRGFEPQAAGRLQDALAGRGDASLPGLGLLLVDRVARAHGGGLKLGPREDGAQGACVELHWPAPPLH